MPEDKSNTCSSCGAEFSSSWNLFASHKERICIVCNKKVCGSCVEKGYIFEPEEKEGLICNVCYKGNKDNIVKSVSITSFGKLLPESHRQWNIIKKEFSEILDDKISKAFNLLLILYCFTIFLVLIGLGYYSKTQSSLLSAPHILFRLCLVIMVIIPSGIHIVSAIIKATKNRSKPELFKDVHNGKPLRLFDYLVGFLYHQEPIQNIWGPIAITGLFSAILLYIILNV